MKMNLITPSLAFLVLLAALALPLPLMQSSVLADDAEATQIAERMKARTEQLNTLKSNQVIGEAWDGKVKLINPEAAVEQSVKVVIEAENTDRDRLFEILAAQLETTKARIAERFRKRRYYVARPDHYVQNASLEWVLKKQLTEE